MRGLVVALVIIFATGCAPGSGKDGSYSLEECTAAGGIAWITPGGQCMFPTDLSWP